MKKVCDKCELTAYVPYVKHMEQIEYYKQLVNKLQVMIGILSASLLVTILCLFLLGCTPI